MSTATALPLDAELDLCALWRELAADPKTPDWFELTEHGELVSVAQPNPKHQFAAGRLLGQVHDHLGDAVVPSVAMLTKAAGIRVPDLVWIPKDDVQDAVTQDPMQLALPLVVDMLSEHDRWPVLAHKVRAYLQTDVRDVAVVRLDGSIAYFRSDGVYAESAFGLQLSVEVPNGDTASNAKRSEKERWQP